jgi:hypothetical protein
MMMKALVWMDQRNFTLVPLISHDGIHIDVDQVMSHIPYELVPLALVMSNHVISAFQ